MPSALGFQDFDSAGPGAPLSPFSQLPRPGLRALLFSPSGRIGRGRFWLGGFAVLGYGLLAGLALVALWQVIPGSVDENGGFNVNGTEALPYFAIILAWVVFSVWSGIALGIKRYHDRDKSGAWILIQFVPFVGSLWYFIEAGCLPGTAGDNKFGPSPLPAG